MANELNTILENVWQNRTLVLCPESYTDAEGYIMACVAQGSIIPRDKALESTPGDGAYVWRCVSGHEFPVIDSPWGKWPRVEIGGQ